MILRKYITNKQIHNRVKYLAHEINKDITENTVFLCVLNGAFMFFTDLLKNIKKTNFEVDFIGVSSYSGISQKPLKFTKRPKLNFKGKRVIIVDDILDSGKTITFIIDYLRKYDIKNIRTCFLLNRNVNSFTPDYVGFENIKKFVVGYGLDYNNRHRSLGDVYQIEE